MAKNDNLVQVIWKDIEATKREAHAIARDIQVPATIALSGPLGAGKTQFVRFLVEALGVPASDVTSPTYVLVHRYVGRLTIYHLDFYRLKSTEEAWQLGIEEFFEWPVLTIIEWAEKFPECLPDNTLWCEIELEPNSDARIVRFSGCVPDYLKQISKS